ncbi:hypothetical protein H072_8350 [Dactylellina haptotyla CBS 200.50]|uniref:GSKIP domain-containing protein n=1 Tax=Dactylellina haptotyla (strain CBS 200.50) TaxID=1284197 RepID=S8BF11_DACHA|nr:hypothetical protein H072_8350 [Dactylellina haptotyla CBS 200.50]
MPLVPPPIPSFAQDTTQLVKEYESFVHQITPDDANTNIIHIETKEHATLTVEVSAAGWKVQKVQPDDAPLQVKMLEGETYELPEGFLMAASDEFKRLWHAALVEKLSALGSFDHEDNDGEDRA